MFAGDCRSYSYVLGLSSEEAPDWNDLLFLAKLIPRILHNINRVCYIFGGPVMYPISDVTDTRISAYSLAQLRQADHLANTVGVDCFQYFFVQNLIVGFFFFRFAIDLASMRLHAKHFTDASRFNSNSL